MITNKRLVAWMLIGLLGLIQPLAAQQPVTIANTPAVTGSGNFATTAADGSNVTLGAKADNRSTSTDTTAITLMQVFKQISFMEQNPATRAVTNAGTFAVQAAQSGTWTVQPGNTANSTPWLFTGSGTAGTAATGVVTVQGIASMTKLLVTPDLPSGASTAAKQPALGTAGSASADVITVQGVASMTSLFVAGAVASGATDAGNPVKIGAVYNSSPITVTNGQRADLQTDANGYLKVNVAAGGASGGTSSSFGATFPATGTAVGASDGTNMQALKVDGSGNLLVAVTGAGSGGTSSADRATYTAGTTAGTAMMIARDDASVGTLAEDKVGIARGSTLREVYTQIRDAAGNDRGANVDASGNVAVSVNNTVTVGSHAVTNAGTFAAQVTVAAGATTIGKAEDVASADGDVGVPAMAVRKATPANTSGTDGDYEPLQMAAGRLWVDASGKTLTVDGSGVTQPVSGTVTAAQATAASLNATVVGTGTFVVQNTQAGTASQNVAQLAGTTTSVNSGNKDAGTLRVTLATDQVQLTNALKVDASATTQPVSGTVTAISGTATNLKVEAAGTGTFAVQPAGSVAHDGAGAGVNPVLTGCYASAAAPTDVSADNDATRQWCLRNGAQAGQPTFAGVLAVAGNGPSGTGVQRVTLANDSTGIIATVSAVTAITNALPTGTNTLGSVKQTDGTNVVITDPCQGQAKVYLPINQTTGTTIITGTSAKKLYLCSVFLISATAQNINLVEGTGTVCATSIAGVTGGTTAGTGPNLAANTGWTMGNGAAAVIATATNADNLCLQQSSTGQISGHIAYAVQ